MFAFCQDMPGVTREQQSKIDALIADKDLEGCLVHVAGLYEGGVRMVDVWTDEASYRRFQTEVLWPALDRLGPALGAQPAEPFAVLEVTGEARGTLAAAR